MRKLILYILTLLPFFALAQNTTTLPTGTSPTGINLRLKNSPDSLKQWWFQSTLDNKYNRFLSATESFKYLATKNYVNDTASRYINLNSGDDLSFTSAQWRDKKQVNYFSIYNPAFPLVSSDPAKPFGYFWMGTVLVDRTTGTGIMRATQWDIELGKVMNEYIRVKDDNQPGWGAWTRIWTDGALPLGTAGQSIRVNSTGTAFEAYTPSTGSGTVTSVTRGLGFQNSGTSITSTGTLDIDTTSNAGVLGKGASNTRYNYLLGRINSIPTPSLQSVTNSGNTTTTRISAQGFDATGTGGVGYFQLPSQSVSPASNTGNLRIYSDSLNRLSWKNSIYRRTLQVPFLSDVTIRFPFKSNPTLADSTNVDNIYYKKTGGTLTGDATIEYNGTPSLSLSNNVSGSKTTFSQSATNNKFAVSVSARPAGGIGGALSTASASSQSINKSNVIPINASPFSIVGWFQRTGGTNQVVYTNNATASANQVSLTLNSSGNYVISHSGTQLGAGNTVGTQWVHIAYTFNGTTGKLLINGVVQG